MISTETYKLCTCDGVTDRVHGPSGAVLGAMPCENELYIPASKDMGNYLYREGWLEGFSGTHFCCRECRERYEMLVEADG